jgi:hypothetical protein
VLLWGVIRTSYRLLLGVVEGIRRSLDDLALDLVCPSTVVPQATGTGTDIALGHGDGLAIVQRLDGGEEVDVLLKQIGELVEVLSALLGGYLPPRAFEGFPRGRYGDVDVLLGGLRYGADDRLVGGVNDLERLAVDALDPLVVDEAVLLVSRETVGCGSKTTIPHGNTGAEVKRQERKTPTGQWAAHTRRSAASWAWWTSSWACNVQ